MTNAIISAQKYIEQGYAVIPIPLGQKSPKMKAWPSLRLKVPDLPQHFTENSNIGIILGEASGGLVDIDLDCGEAVQLATHFLPSTLAIFGRKTRGRSHYLYHCPALSKRIPFDCGGMVLEIRAASNLQTMFPPSVHPSGESVTWYQEGVPAVADEAKLLDACQKLALASVILRHWPVEGGRHTFALYLSGFLLQTLKWSEEDAAHLIEVVATAAGDNEVSDRVNTVASTLDTLEAGEPVKGISGLMETMPADVIKSIEKWFKSQPKRVGKAALSEDKEIDAMIDDINNTYAFVGIGGKSAILKETPNDDNQFSIIGLDLFYNTFRNKIVFEGKKPVSIAKVWMEHPRRREYPDGVVFRPAETTSAGYFNIFRGWPRQANSSGSCDLFLKHIRDNVCEGNDEYYRYIIGWFAAIFQKPQSKAGTSLVIRGKQGTGKSKIGEVFAKLLGNYYVKVSNEGHLLGNFNAHLAAKLLVHAEEGFWAGGNSAAGRFKDMITSDSMLLEYKGKDAIRIDNLCRFLVTTNSDWAIPAALEERRFTCFEIGEAQMQNHAYFAAIDAQLEQGGYERLMHEMLTFDLASVDLRKIPQTAALADQKMLSLAAEEQWWLDMLMSGHPPYISSQELKKVEWHWEGATKIPTYLLQKSYTSHAGNTGMRWRASETTLGKKLKKFTQDKIDKKILTYVYTTTDEKGIKTTETGRSQHYLLPSLDECRALFEAYRDTTYDWPEEMDRMELYTDAEF